MKCEQVTCSTTPFVLTREKPRTAISLAEPVGVGECQQPAKPQPPSSLVCERAVLLFLDANPRRSFPFSETMCLWTSGRGYFLLRIWIIRPEKLWTWMVATYGRQAPTPPGRHVCAHGFTLSCCEAFAASMWAHPRARAAGAAFLNWM